MCRCACVSPCANVTWAVAVPPSCTPCPVRVPAALCLPASSKLRHQEAGLRLLLRPLPPPFPLPKPRSTASRTSKERFVFPAPQTLYRLSPCFRVPLPPFPLPLSLATPRQTKRKRASTAPPPPLSSPQLCVRRHGLAGLPQAAPLARLEFCEWDGGTVTAKGAGAARETGCAAARRAACASTNPQLVSWRRRGDGVRTARGRCRFRDAVRWWLAAVGAGGRRLWFGGVGTRLEREGYFVSLLLLRPGGNAGRRCPLGGGGGFVLRRGVQCGLGWTRSEFPPRPGILGFPRRRVGRGVSPRRRRLGGVAPEGNRMPPCFIFLFG